MPSDLFFDEINDSPTYNRPDKPFWKLPVEKTDPHSEKEVLDWLNGELEFLQSEVKPRLERVRRNLALYKGIQYQTQETRTDVRERNEDRSRLVQKIVVNHLYDLVENRVSRLIKYRPGVSILPTNDEFADKISAKSVEALLNHIWYSTRFDDELCPDVARKTEVAGESYLFVTWDPDKGDLSPEYEDAKRELGSKEDRIPLLDDHGAQSKDEDGEPIFIDQPIRVGDVKYEVVMTVDVLLQRKETMQECEFAFRRKVMTVDEARLRYPKAAAKLKAGTRDFAATIYDYDKMHTRSMKNQVVIWEFYHKRTKPMDKGRYVVFTHDAILSSTEFPYTHRELPFVRFTDIENPGELHGTSFIDKIKGLTGAYNNLTNMILRNQILVSHPKWMVPAGSCKIDQLGNDITITQYKGPIAPVLVQANPTPREIFEFRGMLKEECQQISGVFGVSRGEPPPGIKAGIALQFLSEQEQERYNQLILKWNAFIRLVAQMTIWVAGDYYDSSDKRMVRVLGKNNKWMSMFFDTAHLDKDYDVRVQNSSALPQSKAARTQYVMDLSERFPNLLPPEQVLDMLDLAQSDKFVDVITTAIRAAQAENEGLMNDKGVPEPEEWEDHIQHWKIHVQMIFEWSFKNQTPTHVKKRVFDHLMATEMLMVEKSKKNPIFAKLIQTLPNFPVLYELAPEAPPPPPPTPPMPPGPGGPMGGPFVPPPQMPAVPPVPPLAAQEGPPMPSVAPALPPDQSRST